MRIIPVIDVMGGVVVRAVGGRREEYRPVVSKLTLSTEPLAVAKALLAATGAGELYVADLDAIRGNGDIPQPSECLRRLTQLPVQVWVDAGLRNDFDEVEWLKSGVTHLVVGTETVSGAGTLCLLMVMYGSERVAVSIDLRDGELIGNWRQWGETPDQAHQFMFRFAHGIDVRRLILLDLAAVGTRSGPALAERIRSIRKEYPHLELLTGGGIRDRDDVKRLEDVGADGVLVASALHDGTLP